MDRVLGGHDDLGALVDGLTAHNSAGLFVLVDLVEYVTQAGVQEASQAPAQSLGGLLRAVTLEELAHELFGLVRVCGQRSRQVSLGLGGGGAVGLQQGQVASLEAAFLHDASGAARTVSAHGSAEVEAAVTTDELEGVHQLPATQSLTGAVSSDAARGQGQEAEQPQQRLPHRDPHRCLEAGAAAAHLPAA